MRVANSGTASVSGEERPELYIFISSGAALITYLQLLSSSEYLYLSFTQNYRIMMHYTMLVTHILS